MIPDEHKKKAAVLAICVACIGGYEGLRTVPYRDASPAKIWTDCYGETKDVKPTDRPTAQQCKDLLAKRVEGDFMPAIEKCITRPMPVKVEAAFVSMGYNIGIEGFCRSGVAKRWNAGDYAGACKSMTLYVHSGDKILKGLVARRNGESQLCLEGLE